MVYDGLSLNNRMYKLLTDWGYISKVYTAYVTTINCYENQSRYRCYEIGRFKGHIFEINFNFFQLNFNYIKKFSINLRKEKNQ